MAPWPGIAPHEPPLDLEQRAHLRDPRVSPRVREREPIEEAHPLHAVRRGGIVAVICQEDDREADAGRLHERVRRDGLRTVDEQGYAARPPRNGRGQHDHGVAVEQCQAMQAVEAGPRSLAALGRRRHVDRHNGDTHALAVGREDARGVPVLATRLDDRIDRGQLARRKEEGKLSRQDRPRQPFHRKLQDGARPARQDLVRHVPGRYIDHPHHDLMRVFAVAPAIPYAAHGMPGVTAVNVVVHDLLQALVEQGHDVLFQLLGNVHRAPTLTPVEETALEGLRAGGIRSLPPLLKETYLQPRSHSAVGWGARAVRLAAGRPDLAAAYPAVRLSSIVRERVSVSGADVVLTIWSPEGVAATHGLDVPRVAFHGDIDFEPGEARYRDAWLFGVDARTAWWRSRGPVARSLALARDRLWQAEFRRSHYVLMDDVDSIANVSALNARHYADRGHRRSYYARNLWHVSTDGTDVPSRGAGGQTVILGHAGRLDSTTSTYGLRYLLVRVLPELERALEGRDWRLDIVGGGSLAAALQPLSRHPRVVMRGFVPDLDREVRSAEAFLILNNAAPFKAAHTRHLVAWSLGACMIVHRDSTLAIPEISDGENALTGGTPREIADLVRRAVTEPDLNARLRKSGRETFLRWFTPTAVASDLAREMLSVIERSRSRR